MQLATNFQLNENDQQIVFIFLLHPHPHLPPDHLFSFIFIPFFLDKTNLYSCKNHNSLMLLKRTRRMTKRNQLFVSLILGQLSNRFTCSLAPNWTPTVNGWNRMTMMMITKSKERKVKVKKRWLIAFYSVNYLINISPFISTTCCNLSTVILYYCNNLVNR